MSFRRRMLMECTEYLVEQEGNEETSETQMTAEDTPEENTDE